jgi:hypothetical protein
MNTDEQTMEPTTYELACYIQKHLNRIVVNLFRAENLVRSADALYPNPPEGLQLYKQDIIRAAVVFLHATLEDFLRYVGSMYLPQCGEDVLNRVALVGSSDVLRPEKFFLGRLVSHRGKSVDQVISESVAAYLDRVSFSDTGEVSRLLEAIGVPLEPLRRFYAPLSSLMARRHQIVHKGDLVPSSSDEPREAMAIDPAVVMEWHAAVKAFISAVIAQKIEHDFASKLRSKRASQPPDNGDVV